LACPYQLHIQPSTRLGIAFVRSLLCPRCRRARLWGNVVPCLISPRHSLSPSPLSLLVQPHMHFPRQAANVCRSSWPHRPPITAHAPSDTLRGHGLYASPTTIPLPAALLPLARPLCCRLALWPDESDVLPFLPFAESSTTRQQQQRVPAPTTAAAAAAAAARQCGRRSDCRWSRCRGWSERKRVILVRRTSPTTTPSSATPAPASGRRGRE